MKLFISLFILLLSLNSFSHCGACGEGEASDHQEKGEDSSHHDSESDSDSEKESKEVQTEDDDGDD
jgi:hypothetical protein